jgi:hypothetical protein
LFKLTQPLTVSVKEKGGKPDRKPHPLHYGLRNPSRNLKSENSISCTCGIEVPAGTSMKLNIHEFSFSTHNSYPPFK